MLPCRSAVLLLLAALLAGCQSQAQRDAGPPSESSQRAAAEIRERYQRLNPKNRVGLVVAVKRDANLAAVGDIAIQDFGIGDVLTFITPREEPFNTGVVVNATADALHVRYESRKREPRTGDLAVRVQ